MRAIHNQRWLIATSRRSRAMTSPIQACTEYNKAVKLQYRAFGQATAMK